MALVSLYDLGFRPAGRNIFDALDWTIEPGTRIGLVGPNGSGKSSLLRILAGEIEPEQGRVVRARGVEIAHLAQEEALPAGASVLEAAMQRPPALARVEHELSRIEASLADAAVYEDERKLARALARQEAALERREAPGGASHGSRVRGLLSHLGFAEASWQTPCEVLSGGQRKLVALAALAAAGPDLLLLDEPDNHLDLVAKDHLERFVRSYPGSVVLVSHDRYMLDGCVDAVAALEGGKLECHVGNYSAYVNERELRRLQQRKAFADQQKEIRRVEAQIARFEHWASLVVNERHIKQARSRRKRLERMGASGQLVERVETERRIGLEIAGSRGSRKALEIRGLAVAPGDDLVLDGLDLLVRHGERVGLVGPNGAGKSLLLRAVLGEVEPFEGKIVLGAGTRVGYYAQQHETLAGWLDRTPLEWVRDVSPMGEGAAVRLLMRFLFAYEQLREPIRRFSGGERSRLQLARIMLERPNLLLLDEPTNHLDIPSVEVLESVLDDFDGAVVVISHDRYFLDTVVDRVEAFEAGALVRYEGGYTDYAERALAGA